MGDNVDNPTGSTRRQFLAATAVAGGSAWFLWRGEGGAAERVGERVGERAGERAGGEAYRGPLGDVTLTEFSPAGKAERSVTVRKVVKTDAQWRRQFSPLAYAVLRKFDDEVPFSGAYYKNHEAGIYRCAGCDTPVFGSANKFDSGTGWPSFTQPLAKENITLRKEGAAAQVLCARCDSFLGDLFDDGPQPSGWRYCINSVSLRFVPANTPRLATAVFAGGCFWGVDAVYKHLRGVTSVTSGYAGGAAATANYETVSDGASGHAESVRVTYDPALVSYEMLLKVFFLVAHDPTQLNRQGPDVGTQYRSDIFVADAAQKAAAQVAIANLERSKVYARKIVTAITPLDTFYVAEAYHQNYLAEHLNQPYIMYNDLPKLDQLRAELPEWYRDPAASR